MASNWNAYLLLFICSVTCILWPPFLDTIIETWHRKSNKVQFLSLKCLLPNIPRQSCSVDIFLVVQSYCYICDYVFVFTYLFVHFCDTMYWSIELESLRKSSSSQISCHSLMKNQTFPVEKHFYIFFADFKLLPRYPFFTNSSCSV